MGALGNSMLNLFLDLDSLLVYDQRANDMPLVGGWITKLKLCRPFDKARQE